LGWFFQSKLQQMSRFPGPAGGFLSRTEAAFLLASALLISSALFIPPIAQDQSYHVFADQRPWGPLANAADTLSNLSFLLAGGWGLWQVACSQNFPSSPLIRSLAAIFLVGVMLTGLASMFYHLAPSDSRLAVDRFAMSLAFAAALALLAADRVSERLAVWLVTILFVLAPLTVWIWVDSGNLTPYAVLQFGGVTLIALFSWRPSLRDPGFNFLGLLLFYGLAKLAEVLDGRIFELTLGLVSGHTLKHLLAALGAIVLVLPIFSRSKALTQFVKR
jgi:hypothetical protein